MSRAQVANGQDNPLLPLDTTGVMVSTASVTIRTLTLGKKQVTQSVFRQMPEAEMIDTQEVKLRGIPWGWVNYHWGNQDPLWTHFIFQQGHSLYRCNFPVRDAPWHYYDPKDREDVYADGLTTLRTAYRREFHAAYCASIVEGRRPESSMDGYQDDTKWKGSLACKPLAFHESIEPSEIYELNTLKRESGQTLGALFFNRRTEEITLQEFRDQYTKSYCYGFLDDDENCKRAMRERIESNKRENADNDARQSRVLRTLQAAIENRVGSHLTKAQILQRMAEIERQAIDFNQRWDALMDQLRGVEQLFIAV